MKWKPAKLYSSLEPHVYGENGQLLAMKKGGATYFYHYNAHGDVIALTDGQGNVVARYEYDTWGQLLSKSGEMADENPYRYAGYQYDEETGLYYLMTRYYHPTHGVFLSLDPDPGDADDILTQNGYTYANNNPVMLVDPDGHFFWFVVNAGFAAYDGYKAFKKGGWKAAAIAIGVGLVGGAAFKGAKIAYRVYKARRAQRFLGKLNLQFFASVSKKSVLKGAMLPTKGKIRYVPPKNWTPSQPLPRKGGGHIDRFGNIWTKGPSRTKGEPFEWDVQLSKRGKQMLGHLSRDGSHLNVSLKGRITH
ncbi:hypothetical protein CS060_03230 [Anoxybacillus flavithermus]|uniref:Uncharacterized protein n=1 Tax=Anoxybacillus flavithermus TaxID=33934 RepID=A0A2G5RST1_9BACL|nr:hypothetical protein CS060_03230 [Anoxybacillus flavithermus]